MKAVAPELAEEIDKKLTLEFYTPEEVKKAFEDIGATLEDGTLDISKIDPKHYNFGYTGPLAYNDPAHKLLLVLTMYEDIDYLYSYDPDYYKEIFKDTLRTMGINHIIKPENGFTGIDHDSRERLEEEVKYNVYDFILRKDYVLILDHD